MHCMTDIETLGLTDDCVILSVGIVYFSARNIVDEHLINMDITHQMNEGRIIDPSTLQWWCEQDVPIPVNGESTWDVIHDILKLYGCDTYWERGNFDYRILNHYLKGDTPWEYGQIRDHRTVIPKMPKSNTHNALEDAVAQVKCLLNSNYNLETGCA